MCVCVCVCEDGEVQTRSMAKNDKE